MSDENVLYPCHPAGGLPSVERDAAVGPVVVDTYAGPIQVEWDPDAAVTPLGHLAFFAEYLKLSGRFDALVTDSPLFYTSPNAPSKRDMLGTAVLSILAGHWRYAHITALRGETVNPPLLGMTRGVSEDAVRRGLDKIEAEAGARWRWCTNRPGPDRGGGRADRRDGLRVQRRSACSGASMPHKVNDPRRHKIPKARYRIENWPAYDAALRDRGDLTVWVAPAALAAWHPPMNGQRGRSPTYSDLAIETGILLRLAFGRPWRQTEGLLRSIARLMNLEVGIPDHTTLSRRSAVMSLALDLAGAKEPVHVVIDSTGLKVYGDGEWHRETHGSRGRRGWRKLHLAVDPDSGEILACELTDKDEGDPTQVGPLLDQVASAIASVTADGAYDGDPVYRAVADRAAEAAVIIPPRSTAKPSAQAGQAPTQRDRHIQTIA